MPTRNRSDLLLLAIVAAIILLVIVAFVIIANRPRPAYQDVDSPEGVVQDYLLALQLGDYERAYNYLAPEITYPGSTEEFFDSLREQPWAFTTDDNYSLIIESSEPISDRSVAVTVRLIYSNNTLFGGDGYAETFQMRLVNDGQGWELAGGERFWSSCWGAGNQCDGVEPPLR